MSKAAGRPDILLRDFRPEPMLRVEAHHPQRFPIPAIDVHNHLGRWFTPTWSVPDVGQLLDLMDDCNVRAIVNLDGGWLDELEANLDRYDRTHPGRFATFCRLDWSETSEAGWGERFGTSIRDSVRRGAAGIKMWKDIGLRLRDEHGKLFMLDDPRLKPVWEAIADSKLPLLIHIADPAAFFLPLDPSNERYEELLAHPDWHFYGPEFPGMMPLLDALEHTVADNPGVTFIGAHVGCYAEDLSWVDRMLSTYPNFNIDISARIAELGRQPRATRRLILKHPDRVMLGTDVFPPQAADYRRYLRFLATEDEAFSYSSSNPPETGRWTISGVHLPDDILFKVIAGNAQRIVPAFAPPT